MHYYYYYYYYYYYNCFTTTNYYRSDGRMELPQQGVVNNINPGIEPAVQQVTSHPVRQKTVGAELFHWCSALNHCTRALLY